MDGFSVPKTEEIFVLQKNSAQPWNPVVLERTNVSGRMSVSEGRKGASR